MYSFIPSRRQGSLHTIMRRQWCWLEGLSCDRLIQPDVSPRQLCNELPGCFRQHLHTYCTLYVVIASFRTIQIIWNHSIAAGASRSFHLQIRASPCDWCGTKAWDGRAIIRSRPLSRGKGMQGLVLHLVVVGVAVVPEPQAEEFFVDVHGLLPGRMTLLVRLRQPVSAAVWCVDLHGTTTWDVVLFGLAREIYPVS